MQLHLINSLRSNINIHQHRNYVARGSGGSSFFFKCQLDLKQLFRFFIPFYPKIKSHEYKKRVIVSTIVKE